MFVSVDRSNRSLSRPPSMGVRVLRSGSCGVSGRVRKKAPNKNHDSGAKRRAKWERIKVRAFKPRLAETWIDVAFFRPARARYAGVPTHLQTFRACARLSLGQCDLLCRVAHERDADLQREPVAHLGADDQLREALLLSLGAPRR